MHAGPGRQDRRGRPGRSGPRDGIARRTGGPARWRDRRPRADRRALPRLQHRVPGRQGRLQPAVRTRYPRDPGAPAGSRQGDPGGFLGDRERLCGVQAPRAAASDTGRSRRGDPGPAGGALPHLAARLRAEHGRAAGGRVLRWAAGSPGRRIRPRQPGPARWRGVRGPDVRAVRAQPPSRHHPHGRRPARRSRRERRPLPGAARRDLGLRCGHAPRHPRRLRRGGRRRRPAAADLRAGRPRRGGLARRVRPARPPLGQAGRRGREDLV